MGVFARVSRVSRRCFSAGTALVWGKRVSATSCTGGEQRTSFFPFTCCCSHVRVCPLLHDAELTAKRDCGVLDVVVTQRPCSHFNMASWSTSCPICRREFPDHPTMLSHMSNCTEVDDQDGDDDFSDASSLDSPQPPPPQSAAGVRRRSPSPHAVSHSFDSSKCSVCLCSLANGEDLGVIQCCDHVFHHSCILQWGVNGANTCPLCVCRFNRVARVRMTSRNFSVLAALELVGC